MVNSINQFNNSQQNPPNNKKTILFPMHMPLRSADRPKGNLLEGRLFDPLRPARELSEAGKTMYKAMTKGDGDDYHVGKLNDAATLLGSLGIATIYSAKAPLKIGKGMEFIGLGCWYAAMSIWPNLVIGGPVKFLTGVDITQKYKDSYGRKKLVWEDYQYNPALEMMSPEKINKIGDRLGIPKNIDNRPEAIKNKMKQVAIQANTLWLLTAGFATPLLSSLIADKLSFLFKNAQETYTVAKTAKALGVNELTENSTNLSNNETKMLNKINHNLKQFSTTVISKFADLTESIADITSKQNKEQRKLIKDINSGKLEVYDINFDQINESEAKSIISKHYKLFEDHYNATLADKDGSMLANSWSKFFNNVAKNLKLEGNDLKELKEIAKCTNEVELQKKIAKYLLNLDSKKLNSVANELELFTEKVHSNNMAAKDRLNEALKKMQAFTENSKLNEETKEAFVDYFEQYRSKIEDRCINANVSFLKTHQVLKKILSYKEDSSFDKERFESKISEIIEGFNVDKLTNNHFMPVKKEGISNIDDLIYHYFKAGNLENKDTPAWNNYKSNLEKIKKVLDKCLEPNLSKLKGNLPEGKLKQLGDWFGKGADKTIQKSFNEFLNYHGWLKTKGLAAGILTGITLFAVLLMGRKNQFNPDIYRLKEDKKYAGTK